MNNPSECSKIGVTKKRVLLVDDHPFTRLGMRYFLNSHPDLTVCAEAEDPREALEWMARVPVDLVLCDLNLPGKGGLELIKDLRNHYPQVPVMVLSMHDEPQFAPRVLRAGARGYLMKSESSEVVVRAIREVLRGKIVVSERMSSLILEIFAGKQSQQNALPEARLSDRELEVLCLMGSAVGTREIARRLSISMKTVEAHRSNMKQKLGLSSSQELIRYAVCWVEESGRAKAAALVAEA